MVIFVLIHSEPLFTLYVLSVSSPPNEVSLSIFFEKYFQEYFLS